MECLSCLLNVIFLFLLHNIFVKDSIPIMISLVSHSKESYLRKKNSAGKLETSELSIVVCLNKHK